jgi:hypothetical protein
MKRGQYEEDISAGRQAAVSRAIICLVTAFKGGGKRVKIDIDGRFEKQSSKRRDKRFAQYRIGACCPLSEPCGTPQFGTYSYVA